jgi:hypothetical protein
MLGEKKDLQNCPPLKIKLLEEGEEKNFFIGDLG